MNSRLASLNQKGVLDESEFIERDNLLKAFSLEKRHPNLAIKREGHAVMVAKGSHGEHEKNTQVLPTKENPSFTQEPLFCELFDDSIVLGEHYVKFTRKKYTPQEIEDITNFLRSHGKDHMTSEEIFQYIADNYEK